MSNNPPPASHTVRARCCTCGDGTGFRNHLVLAEHSENDEDTRSQYWWYQLFQIVKCVGCDTVRFRRVTREAGVPEGDVDLYPQKPLAPYDADADLAALHDVGSIYRETAAAMNDELAILAAGGIRACVEAICKEQGVKEGNLEKKIDSLTEKSLLTEAQAKMLHACRFMGNTALHELKAPPMEDNRLALGIVESLMRTIYVYPKRAKELEDRHGRRKDQQ